MRGDTGARIAVEMLPADEASGAAARSVSAFRTGSCVGLLFDRRKNAAQLFVDGQPTQELLFNTLGFKLDVEALQPAVCLAQDGARVCVEYARFVSEVGAVPAQYTFGARRM